MATSVVWFRRDLRIADHPALTTAAGTGPVVGAFVVDPRLWDHAGAARRAWLAASLQALSATLGGRLVLRYGDPAQVVPALAEETGAHAVHVTGETTPFGRRRDARVAQALASRGTGWVATGSPYAVDPGSVRNRSGDPYQVFTPFARAWREHGWGAPLPPPNVVWVEAGSDARAVEQVERAAREAPVGVLRAGPEAAVDRWASFRDGALAGYEAGRDQPARDGTSRMSAHLKVGSIHPRQLLADLVGSPESGRFVTELGWREFYADVLWHHPLSAWTDLRPLAVAYDDPGDALDAWRTGHTGFPLVDAGMRQLLHEGWMHNRVRMVTASFLTKDLHAWWPAGARHFLDHLADGDLASNSHGWQWVAGTGTDAAPYFRIFNPISQGKRFDPDGEYVRRWVPELAHLPGPAAHEPWRHPDGYLHGYPLRIVDHDAERRVALDRYASR
jgi:deoxyribodipyrimidine photo-lyase